MVCVDRYPTFAAAQITLPLVYLYNLFVFIYQAVLRLAARRNVKARAWVKGRQGQWERIQQELAGNSQPVVWVHSASTGEFEQAKPVIEALRRDYPHFRIVATFFSPSGYEAAANYAHIHHRYYLPLDTAQNAARFMALVQPALVIFSKYDFWHHHIRAVRQAGVPLLLISSIFRKGQLFFRWYGGFYRQILQQFSHIFVQDEGSRQLLRGIGIHNCSISGDTRFDRVVSIAAGRATAAGQASVFASFIGSRPCLVAGSTWPEDEALLAATAKAFPDYCFLVVPHEINKTHILELEKRFPEAYRYSERVAALQQIEPSNFIEPPVEKREGMPGTVSPQGNMQANVMIVDAMGLLSALYALADLTYVGGGFTKDGIHNTLEAAVWGKPVIIGPNYQKYREARELIARGAAFSVNTAPQLQQLVQHFAQNKAALEAASETASNYVLQNAGATGSIMTYIKGII